MYAFLNSEKDVSRLIEQCDLAKILGPGSEQGSAQIFGEDLTYPDVIHFYPHRNPLVTDPHRLIMLETKAFNYKEVN